MSREFELSRRKILGAVGGVGIASAGAGMGTSAFFSDTESFEGNSLTAGELDLKLDFEEHYYDESRGTSLVEQGDPATADYVLPGLHQADLFKGGNIRGVQTSMYVDEHNKPIALNFVDPDGSDSPSQIKDEFWDATSIDALPDTDDDGIQELPDDPCSVLPDFGADNDGLNSPERTEKYRDEPLINLQDVKPGDFGEVTFSFHLCDNPGYVWLQGELDEAAENGVTEPEGEDPQEDGDEDLTVTSPEHNNDGAVELLDNVVTRFWYDDCDNQVDVPNIPGTGADIDVMLAIDISGSVVNFKEDVRQGIKGFVDTLPSDGTVNIGALTFGEDVDVEQELVTPDNFSYDPDDSEFANRFDTPMPAALDIADQILTDDSLAGVRSGVAKQIVLITDGGPNYRPDVTYSATYGGGSKSAPRGGDYVLDGGTFDGSTYVNGSDDSSVDCGELLETEDVAEEIKAGPTTIATVFIGDPTFALACDDTDVPDTLNEYLADRLASPGFATGTEDFETFSIPDVASQLAISSVVGEEVFFVGTLRQALMQLSGDGIPLDAGRSTGFDEIGGDPASENREAFEGNGTTHCIGFEWWLPVDHANQIQSDRVAFDIGFRAEQSRHNDGSGQSA